MNLKLVPTRALILAFCAGYFPFLINGWFYATTQPSTPVFWMIEVAYWVILPSLIFLYLIKTSKLTVQDLGIHQKLADKKDLSGLIFCCVLFLCCSYSIYAFCVSFGQNLVGNIPSLFSYKSMQSSVYLYKFLSALFFAATVAIVEELYYRGLLYKIIEPFNYQNIIYLIISPVLFSLAHWEQGMDGLLSNYIFGLIYCIVYIKLKNLWPLIIGHFSVDYIYYS